MYSLIIRLKSYLHYQLLTVCLGLAASDYNMMTIPVGSYHCTSKLISQI